jgi:hypothetical protein
VHPWVFAENSHATWLKMAGADVVTSRAAARHLVMKLVYVPITT